MKTKYQPLRRAYILQKVTYQDYNFNKTRNIQIPNKWSVNKTSRFLHLMRVDAYMGIAYIYF